MFAAGPSLAGNDEGIQFMPEETPFQQLLDKAKAENKIIFIDAYTTWCGPCKWLVANVFTDPEVGAYFNQNFINAKIDMEKGQGVELAKRYEVRAYPTLLFIDGDGEVVHRICGASPKEDFLKKSKVALDNENNLKALVTNYNTGNRDLSFLSNYLTFGASACMEMGSVASEYWSLMDKEAWASEETWDIFQNYVRDINSDQFEFMINNIEKFKSNEKRSKQVDDYAENMMYYALARPIYNKDAEKLDEYRHQIDLIDLEPARKALCRAAMLEYEKVEDWKKYVSEAGKYIQNFGLDNAGMINSMSWKIYENVEDKDLLIKAAGWMEKLLQNEQNKKYMYIDTHAALLLKSGNIEEGKKVANEAIELAKTTGEDYASTEELLKKF